MKIAWPRMKLTGGGWKRWPDQMTISRTTEQVGRDEQAKRE